MKIVRQLLESKGNSILAVTPDTCVYDALVIMAEKHVGALLVMEGDRLVGIFSERDYAREIALKGKTSRDTPISAAMTPQHCLITVTLNDTVESCMNLISDKRIRHLPVLDDGRVVGVLSIGDLVKETIAHQRFLIDQLESYIKS
ncbi:inosine-5'-monophosphate dehydrogenase [mine drainage metagenome]|jgi:CBS domain-containing protein|uniref:Inosine-5'-monophosphate dehydrogenase n=1 Tax=mine drainage metagenome TaxID=410659 RepID=A0A1J5PHK9_9ZZZZ